MRDWESGYPKFYIRTNNLSGFYSDVVLENYYKSKSIFEHLINNNEITNENSMRLDNFRKAVCIGIVFADMCIESMVNDFIAACLGDSEYYDNFDKLSTISKLALISQFIFKQEFDKSSKLYSSIKELIKHRNKYVHNKSEQFPMECLKSDEIDIDLLIDTDELININDLKYDIESIKNACIAILETAKFLDRNDSNVHAVSRLFGYVFVANDEVGRLREMFEREFISCK